MNIDAILLKKLPTENELQSQISTIDASKISGVLSLDNIPQGALERMIIVDDDTARYQLTKTQVQNGDVVKVNSTGRMYYITDENNLNSVLGYEEFAAGTAASVPWSGVTGKPSFSAVATSGQYSDLSGIPTMTSVKGDAESSYRTGQVNITPTNIGLGNVGNFKAVSTVANQGLTSTEQSNARTNIGAGTSSFDGNYNNLSNKPTIPAAVAVKGDAESSYRTGNVNLTAANIGAAASSHTHTKSQITDFPTTMTPSSHSHAASDISSGTLGVARGGTGLSSITSGSYMIGNGTSNVSLKTPAQVLSDIGAAASGHDHSGVYQPAGSYAAASHTHAAGDITSGTLAITRGGTGATSAAAARTALDVYSKGEVDAKAPGGAWAGWGDENATGDAAWWDRLKTWTIFATKAQLAACVGKTKSVTLTSAVRGVTTHLVRCIGYDCDGDNTLTFQTDACFKEATNANNYFCTSNEYTAFDSQALWTNGTQDSQARRQCKAYYNAFPGKNAIRSVNKRYLSTRPNSQGATACDKVYSETVFLPSMGEMGYTLTSSYSGASDEFASENTAKTPYQYYTSNALRKKNYIGSSTSAGYYWTRSRYYDSYVPDRACYVYNTGTASYGGYDYGGGLAPAFAIG